MPSWETDPLMLCAMSRPASERVTSILESSPGGPREVNPQSPDLLARQFRPSCSMEEIPVCSKRNGSRFRVASIQAYLLCTQGAGVLEEL